MKKQKLIRHMFVADALLLLLVAYIFLYLAPSVEVRQRMIYIIPQVAVFGLLVFTSRYLFGVYRELHFETGVPLNSRMLSKLIMSDMAAAVVYYLFQLIIPVDPMKVTFVRVASIAMLNLVLSVMIRLVYQSVYEFAEEYIDRSDRY